MLENMFQLSRAVKRPIAMFVDRSDSASIEAAVDAGVSAYVVDGLQQERVKPILDMAISRFNAFSRMTRELEEARRELENRKLVDRAKGILMKSRGLSRGGRLRAAAQDGDEPEPQDRRDRAEPDHRRRPARAGRGRMTMSASIRSPPASCRCSTAPCLSPPRRRALPRAEGIDLALVRETLLGQYPRPLAVGHFQVAHMLAPMPIACNLGLTPLAAPTIAPMALGLGGNAVTVSNDSVGGDGRRTAPRPISIRAPPGARCKAVIAERAGRPRRRCALRVVHPHSGHNYELRYWLAACGIDPERDIEIVIVPPPLMADALGSRRASTATASASPGTPPRSLHGYGHIATVKAAIWRSSPEKVLGVGASVGRRPTRRRWPRCCARSTAPPMVRATPATMRELAAHAVATRPISDGPAEWMLPALSGDSMRAAATIGQVADFFVPLRQGRDLPVEEPCAVVLHADGALGSDRAHAAERSDRARDLSARSLSRRAEAARRRAAGRQRQGRGRAASRRHRSARPAPAWCSVRTGSSTARSSIRTSSTPTSPAQKTAAIEHSAACVHCTNFVLLAREQFCQI